MEEKKITKKQYNWNLNLTLLFGILVGIFIGTLLLGVAYSLEVKSHQETKLGTTELIKILLEAQQACMDYANLTSEEFQEVFFEWGVDKIREERYG